jgi:hypothetical protein
MDNGFQTETFINFIIERDAIRERREAGLPKPWTADKILAGYRFTNVRREDDPVTKWIRVNWRDPHKDDPDLWFAVYVARIFNQPATLARIGYPVPFSPAYLTEVVSSPNSDGSSIFRAAYIIPSDTAHKGRPKVDYLVEKFEKAWAEREFFRPLATTLESYHTHLTESLSGVGSFLAGQIVADLKFVEPLLSAVDWKTFAASGPGSRAGLNFLLGRDAKAPWTEDAWRGAFRKLREQIDSDLQRSGFDLSGQDLQNCLCEMSKYARALTGKGRPKQKFR